MADNASKSAIATEDKSPRVTKDTITLQQETKQSPITEAPAEKTAEKKVNRKKNKDKMDAKQSRKKRQRQHTSDDSSSDSTSSSSSSSDDISSDTDTDSESSDGKAKRKARQAKAAKKLKAKQKKNRKRSSKGEDTSESDEESLEDQLRVLAKTKSLKKALRNLQLEDEEDSDSSELDEDPQAARLRALRAQIAMSGRGGLGRGKGGLSRRDHERRLLESKKKVKSQKKKRASKVAFKRVDQLWDQSIHNYKLTETKNDPDQDEWDQYIFTVRRKFDWENKYQDTWVDIKSKPLTECLQHVMKDVKGVSLAQDTPHVDPNMLFLYLEEFRAYCADLRKASESAKKKKERKAGSMKAQHLKTLVKYLDKDYAETKKTLYPMLENNMITFDLLWALYKPNTIAYCTTYGDQDQPRAFKMDYATKESHFMKGTWYSIEGRYLEYDGKSFGMGICIQMYHPSKAHAKFHPLTATRYSTTKQQTS